MRKGSHHASRRKLAGTTHQMRRGAPRITKKVSRHHAPGEKGGGAPRITKKVSRHHAPYEKGRAPRITKKVSRHHAPGEKGGGGTTHHEESYHAPRTIWEGQPPARIREKVTRHRTPYEKGSHPHASRRKLPGTAHHMRRAATCKHHEESYQAPHTIWEGQPPVSITKKVTRHHTPYEKGSHL